MSRKNIFLKTDKIERLSQRNSSYELMHQVCCILYGIRCVIKTFRFCVFLFIFFYYTYLKLWLNLFALKIVWMDKINKNTLHTKWIVYVRKIKFIIFYNLYFPLIYNPVMSAETSDGESDSHLTGFFSIFIPLLVKQVPTKDLHNVLVINKYAERILLLLYIVIKGTAVGHWESQRGQQ